MHFVHDYLKMAFCLILPFTTQAKAGFMEQIHSQGIAP